MRRVGAGLKRLVLVLSAMLPAVGLARGQAAPGCALLRIKPPATRATFSLDGVELDLHTSFLADSALDTSDPNTAIQVATAVAREPVYREFSITAVPYGLSPPTESLPAAWQGGAADYRAALSAYREGQDGDPQEGPTVRLFGEDVTGSTSIVDLHIDEAALRPVRISEWVVEAGDRIWIVRASQELEDQAAPGAESVASPPSFSRTKLTSRNVYQASTSLRAMRQDLPPTNLEPHMSFGLQSAAPDLPFPSWWSGECDMHNYYAVSGVAAYPLGAEYRGMEACGPRPWADYGPEVWVNFGAGAAQIEWQCPELTKRFLYLAYGIPPYSGHGSQVVWNYDGDLLEKVSNCVPGRTPQPDDVLSYGSTSTYGHTSVVIASDVDSGGNGTIGVIEQNSSSTGFSTLAVRDWCVAGDYTTVSGWLHEPGEECLNGWLTEYYGDSHLGDRCSDLCEEGIYIHGSWGASAPAAGCPPDRFSARFSRTVDLPGGDYTFGLGYDESARLKIDGETVVDGWEGADQHYETRRLESGSHEVSVEFAENLGDAYLTAFWWGPGFELSRATRDSSRWYAEYWGNQTLWWDPLAMINGGDGPLDEQWFGEAPVDGVPPDHFSSRFRRVVSLEDGRWQFNVFADDGVRFWVNDQMVLDEWQDQVAVFTPTVSLRAGDHELRIEHYENLGHAKIGLDWEQVSEEVTPIAWVVSPSDGVTIDACPITIEVQVADEVGAVERVEFHARYDGRWHHIGIDDASPYHQLWDCVPVDNQTVWLMVHVWDDEGREFVDVDGYVSVVLDHLEYFHLPLILKAAIGDS